MDWQDHMMENVKNWLLGSGIREELDRNFLLPFGNPYLFQKELFFQQFSDIEKIGLFYKAKYQDMNISFTEPVFGAPMVSMYTEILHQMGVRNIIGCGYVGGLTDKQEIGSYVIPSAGYGFDGTSRSYSPHRVSYPASDTLYQSIKSVLSERNVKYESGPIVSIDALMLENDKMISDFIKQGFYCVDLETACLYGLGNILGINVAAVHIVTDNPYQKNIDEEMFHEASMVEQIHICLESFKLIV